LAVPKTWNTPTTLSSSNGGAANITIRRLIICSSRRSAVCFVRFMQFSISFRINVGRNPTWRKSWDYRPGGRTDSYLDWYQKELPNNEASEFIQQIEPKRGAAHRDAQQKQKDHQQEAEIQSSYGGNPTNRLASGV
jgi:hypothetical protein